MANGNEGSTGWAAFGVLSLISGIGIMVGMAMEAEAAPVPVGSPNTTSPWTLTLMELKKLGVPHVKGSNFIEVPAKDVDAFEATAREVIMRSLPPGGFQQRPGPGGSTRFYMV